MELESGFSARDAIDALVGVYEVELEWLSGDGPIVYAPGESTVGLRFELMRPSESDARLYFVEGLDCLPGSTCTVTCLTQLQFHTSALFRTDDMVFDEEWEVRVGTWKAGKSFARLSLDLTTVNGSLSPDDFQNAAGWRVQSYQVELELNNGLASGRFQVFAEATNGAGVELGTLAVWPPLPAP